MTTEPQCEPTCTCRCHQLAKERAQRPARVSYVAGRMQGMHGRAVPKKRTSDADYLRGWQTGWRKWTREQQGTAPEAPWTPPICE